ncbi:hypothetical protein PGB90_007057 [Kerria lacca]
MSTITGRPRDCMPCKLISGGGLIGMGLYVGYFSQKYQKLEKIAMLGITAGLIYLGTARFLDLYPFPLNVPKKVRS